MKNEMIWAYMLYLGDHMWEDETSEPNMYLPKPYREEMRTDVHTWDAVISFLAERKYNMVLVDVGDGIKFDSHPEISAPNAWEKDFVRKKLDEMRALGLEPIPKLNFSAGHDTWLKKYRRMIPGPPSQAHLFQNSGGGIPIFIFRFVYIQQNKGSVAIYY